MHLLLVQHFHQTIHRSPWAENLPHCESVRFASVRSSVRSRLGPPKLEIAAVKTAAISHSTTEIPQTDFCFDHLAGTPFRECPSFLFTAPQILSRALIQKHQTGHQNPLDRKFIVSFLLSHLAADALCLLLIEGIQTIHLQLFAQSPGQFESGHKAGQGSLLPQQMLQKPKTSENR